MSDPHVPHPWQLTQDPDLLRRILDNEANDIITRQTEQEIKRREIETGHEYSLKLLDAQLMDRQRDREYFKSTNINSSIRRWFSRGVARCGILLCPLFK